VGAVLGDALRISVLGSVYSSSVTRFLASQAIGVESRVINMPGVSSASNGIAVSRDGSTLLVCDSSGGSHAIHEFRVVDGLRLRVIGGAGDEPLQFNQPCQVWVASDDFAFVADYGSDRVQVLTPRLDFYGFVGVGQLSSPAGVCADDTVVVVAEQTANRISVFNRGDGALLRRLGSHGNGDGELYFPHGLCFMPGHRHVAVADYTNGRVCVFSVDGEFIRHVGARKFSGPFGVACSAFGELVVADATSGRVVVFSASGEVLKTMRGGSFAGVAIHGGTVFAQDRNSKCVVFK
jgi:DNA-binding beta-propeller fold protein YncE